jgi:hypothetical protein
MYVGYLVEEKCIETAKTFLNESPNLQECRSVLSHGRHFTTRVCGYALMDILENYCIISSIGKSVFINIYISLFFFFFFIKLLYVYLYYTCIIKQSRLSTI